ncbi:hypothetical protein [Paraburkholderia sp. PGU19]|nr:hypothetical protein [Paraburkholderia sp. PGU19]
MGVGKVGPGGSAGSTVVVPTWKPGAGVALASLAGVASDAVVASEAA